MFLNPIWSLLLLCVGGGALYFFIIRPRLKATHAELYAELDGFWAKVWFIVSTFKKTMVAIGGLIVTSAPDILANWVGFDFSPYLPAGKAHWALLTGPVIGTIILLLKFFDSPKAAS